MDTQVGQGAARLLLHTSVVDVLLHCSDNHSVPADLADGNLVLVVMREVRASEAGKVLDARLLRPGPHGVEDHLDGAGAEDDPTVLLLHGEVPQGTDAEGLDAWVLLVQAQAGEDGLHALGPGDLAAVLVVQCEVRNGRAALLPHLGVADVVLHAQDNEGDAPLHADGLATGRELRDVGKGAAALALDARIGLEGAERLADDGDPAALAHRLLHPLQAAQNGEQLAATLLDPGVLGEGAHGCDDEVQKFPADGQAVVRQLRVAQGHESPEAVE
mmetsp:Transcript_130333/g.405437  ORF Transcript_130333/g.405437 Transcript_130333/m.405437 type:complete len:273 (-) Transcript_130333:329-1147(-)